MNDTTDPWSTLVATLSGTRRHTPSRWPAARVHRMLDDPQPIAPPPRRALVGLGTMAGQQGRRGRGA